MLPSKTSKRATIKISEFKLPLIARRYLDHRRPKWSRYWIYTVHLFLCHFHRWLDEERIEIQVLTEGDIRRFIDENAARAPSKRELYSITLRGYVIWLAETKRVPLNIASLLPDYHERWDRSLPPLAQRYYEERSVRWRHPSSRRRSIYAISRLHLWMKRHDVAIADLNRESLEKFLQHVMEVHPYNPLTLHGFRVFVRLYLDWLVDHGHLPELDLSGLFPRAKDQTKKRLSPNAKEFMELLPATRREKTCFGYQASLCHYYSFLWERKIPESQITRKQLEAWFAEMTHQGLAPATRRHLIRHIKTYLHWLQERGELRRDPETLIRNNDLPRPPKLLPRPLPPDIDRELQKRLEASDDIFHHGLLILRRTGIRIGELCAMPFDCVRQDHAGQWSLKVPLGKLNNERMVPLDAQTLALIRKVQARIVSLTGEERPSRLFQTKFSQVALYCWFNDALRDVCQGIQTAEPIVPHRLRHTFATSLLNGGMSLYGVMRLLGHRSVTTTLIYASVAQETIRREYHSALQTIEKNYAVPEIPAQNAAEVSTDPVANIADTIRLLQRGGQRDRRTALVIKRLKRLQSEIEALV